MVKESLLHFSSGASANPRLGVSLQLFGSVMLPSAAQLQQMRERPWNGVHFSEE